MSDDALFARWGAAFARLAAFDADAPVCPAEAHLAPLAALPADWDGEGADPPSVVAIEAARTILRDLAMHGVHPEAEDIDADVMGGVAVYLRSATRPRYVWLAFSNDGAHTVHLVAPDAPPRVARLSPEAVADALVFIRG